MISSKKVVIKNGQTPHTCTYDSFAPMIEAIGQFDPELKPHHIMHWSAVFEKWIRIYKWVDEGLQGKVGEGWCIMANG